MIDGGRSARVYGGRIAGWTTLSAAALYQAWAARFTSEDEAIASAVWAANRLVKGSTNNTKRKFYSIKEGFITRYGGGQAQVTREEIARCWYCADGIDEEGEPCRRCDGHGVYSRRTLYVYAFEVAGQAYRLHSYLTPRVLVPGKGDEAETFGRPFTPEEAEALPLPLTGLVHLLGYVAAAKWQMTWDGEKYVERRRERDE